MFNKVYDIPFSNLTYFGNSVGSYIVMFLAFLVFLIALKLLQVGVIGYLRRLSKKTKTDIDDTLVEIIDVIKPPFYSFIAFYFSTFFITLSTLAQTTINALLLIWVIYQILLAVQVLIDYVVGKKFINDDKDEGSQGVARFISGILKAVLWAIGLLVILSNLGVNVNSLIAGLGIGGLAIAFALQNILADLFSSFAIHMDKPFKVGDFIVVGDYKGVVKKIGIKTTRITALQGEEVVISNTELTSARVQNFKKLKERRVSFEIGVLYETSIDKVKEIPSIIENAVRSANLTRFDRSHFTTFADSALIFNTVYYVESDNYLEYATAQQLINIKIMEDFALKGIEFAYPTQKIYMAK